MATKRVTKPATPRTSSVSADQYLLNRLREPSTWAGLLTLGAAFATGGAASWLNPETLPILTAGIGLILNKEGE